MLRGAQAPWVLTCRLSGLPGQHLGKTLCLGLEDVRETPERVRAIVPLRRPHWVYAVCEAIYLPTYVHTRNLTQCHT